MPSLGSTITRRMDSAQLPIRAPTHPTQGTEHLIPSGAPPETATGTGRRIRRYELPGR